MHKNEKFCREALNRALRLEDRYSTTKLAQLLYKDLNKGSVYKSKSLKCPDVIKMH